MKQYREKPLLVRGGLTLGKTRFKALNASWPFAKLEIHETEIKLSVGTGTVLSFSKNCVVAEKYKGFINKGIRFKSLQKDSNLPAFIVFWVLSRKKLREILESLE